MCGSDRRLQRRFPIEDRPKLLNCCLVPDLPEIPAIVNLPEITPLS